MGYGIFYSHLEGEAARRNRPVEEILKEAAALGADRLTLSDTALPEALPHIKAAGCGVNILYCVCQLIHGEDLDKAKAAAHAAAEAGAEILMLVPGFYREGQTFQDALKTAAPLISEIVSLCDGLGIHCAIEDYGGYLTPYSLVPQIREFLAAVTGLKFVYDSGNILYHRQDPLELWDATVDRIVGVHGKDLSFVPSEGSVETLTPARDRMYPTAFGSGALKSEEIRARIRALRIPPERITFEHDGNGAPDSFEFLRKSLEFIRG